MRRALPVFLLLAAGRATAQEAGETTPRPRVGLVLSGGGARGCAHVGVLEVLEELHVPVDVVSGTSMGAIVGSLFALGYAPHELRAILADIDWADAFEDRPPRPQRSFRRKQDDIGFLSDLRLGLDHGALRVPLGLIEGQRLGLLLRSLTAPAALIESFDDFPRPFRAVAMDVETGAAVVMDRGDLPSALRASMSIPGVFSPVERDGWILMDGGFADNVPIGPARAMDADVLIVVDLSEDLPQREDINSPLMVVNQVLGYAVTDNSRASLATLGARDVVIRPVLEGMSSTEFARVLEAVDAGVCAARAQAETLRALALPPEEYARHRAGRARQGSESPFIDEVRIDDNSDVSAALIRRRTAAHAGRPLDLPALQRDLAELYGLDQHASLGYRVVREKGRTILEVRGRRRDWGSTFLRFSANGQTDFRGNSQFNGGASMTSTGLDDLGAEWRTVVAAGTGLGLFSEYYQPLDLERAWFLAPGIEYEEHNVGVFDDAGNRIAEVRPSQGYLGLRAGRNFGQTGSLQAAVFRGTARSHLLTGDPMIDDSSVRTGGFSLVASLDSLDELDFPSSGALGLAIYNRQVASLGADLESELMNIALLWAESAGRHSLLLWTDLGLTLSSDVDDSEPFGLGGLFALSGTPIGALTGANAGVARAIYRWQVSDSVASLGVRSWVGGSLELGDVWDDHDDVGSSARAAASLMYAIDTPLGPIYLGAGVTEGGASSFYLSIGRTFSGGLGR